MLQDYDYELPVDYSWVKVNFNIDISVKRLYTIIVRIYLFLNKVTQYRLLCLPVQSHLSIRSSIRLYRRTNVLAKYECEDVREYYGWKGDIGDRVSYNNTSLPILGRMI